MRNFSKKMSDTFFEKKTQHFDLYHLLSIDLSSLWPLTHENRKIISRDIERHSE